MSGEQNYCASCGAELDPHRPSCVECGYEPGSDKSAALAALLSLLITGLGQLYAGEVLRGAGWFLGSLTAAVLIAATVPRLAVVTFLFPLAAAFDAYALTKTPT